MNYADYYQLANNYVRLEASDDIAALECFQQGALFLDRGRFPQAGEAGVCVVDGLTAAQLGLELEDTVELTVLSSAEDGRFDLTAGEDTRTLEVVGITNALEDYPGCLWVSSAEGGFGQPLFGYQLGRAVLDNARGRRCWTTQGAARPPTPSRPWSPTECGSPCTTRAIPPPPSLSRPWSPPPWR